MQRFTKDKSLELSEDIEFLIYEFIKKMKK